MNLYKNQSQNVFKTWVLMTGFLAFVIAIGWFISYYYQDPSILYVAVAFAFFINFFSYWYSDKIVLKMHKAHPATREEHFDLWTITENLAITAGLPMPKLFILDDPSPNAFATGRDKEHAVVAVTSGLLEILDRNELQGVIAHELAHIGNRDILLQTIVVVLAGFIAILSDIFFRAQLHGGRRNGRAGGALVIIGVVFIVLAPVAATIIRLAISRKREFLADATGALLTRYPEGLASALKKISSAGIPISTARDATAHLFIMNPFGGGKTSGFHKLFMTHPSVEDRIRALIGTSNASNNI